MARASAAMARRKQLYLPNLAGAIKEDLARYRFSIARVGGMCHKVLMDIKCNSLCRALKRSVLFSAVLHPCV